MPRVILASQSPRRRQLLGQIGLQNFEVLSPAADETYDRALAPDEIYDRDGCFSGSALTLEDGRHLLMYTGVLKERQRDGGLREIQTQCIAVGDGIDYVKYAENPVLDEMDVPEGGIQWS